MKKILKFGCLGTIGFAVLIVILVVIAGGASKSTGSTGQTRAVSASQNVTQANNKAANQDQSVTTSIPEATVAPTPIPSVGQDVTVDEMRWKMITAEDLGKTLKSNNQFIKDKSTSGRF